MLVLALRSDPDRVYERALRYFTPDEIGEAFAAIQGMAIPTELQTHLKEDERDLVGRFRELAPATRGSRSNVGASAGSASRSSPSWGPS